jgi:hypothetical protein
MDARGRGTFYETYSGSMLIQASCRGVAPGHAITVYDSANDCTGNVKTTAIALEVVNEMHYGNVAASSADGCFNFLAAG